MKTMRKLFVLCMILCSHSILSTARDSINVRLAYDDPVKIYKKLCCKSDAITIESDTEIDEYFYITVYKKTHGHVYLKGVSNQQIVHGWIDLKKEQLYIIIKDTEESDIKLYRRPHESNRYFVKIGNFGLYPIVDLNIHTGWLYIRYTDGKCYWVSSKIQCPWYTECYGS